MKRKGSRDQGTYILVVAGAVPLLIWRFQTHSHWPEYVLQAYLMTTVLFGILLFGEYPPLWTTWFWKSMIPIIALHAVIPAASLVLTVESFDLELPIRMIYGLSGATVLAEWWVCLRIIEALQP